MRANKEPDYEALYRPYQWVWRAIILFILAVAGVCAFAQNSGTISISGASGGVDAKIAILKHTESDSIGGGNYISSLTWQSRPVKSKPVDEIGITLVGDTSFTLPAGRYLVYFNSYFNNTGDYMQSRLYNNTSSTELYRGIICRNGIEEIVKELAFISLTEESNLSVQHIGQFTFTNAYGIVSTVISDPPDWSGHSVYANIVIVQI